MYIMCSGYIYHIRYVLHQTFGGFIDYWHIRTLCSVQHAKLVYKYSVEFNMYFHLYGRHRHNYKVIATVIVGVASGYTHLITSGD